MTISAELLQNSNIFCHLNTVMRITHNTYFFAVFSYKTGLHIIHETYFFFFFPIMCRAAHYTLDIFLSLFSNQKQECTLYNKHMFLFFFNTNKGCALYTRHFLVFLNQNKKSYYMRDIFFVDFSLKITGPHYTRYICLALLNMRVL